jgi:hypothetical protein
VQRDYDWFEQLQRYLACYNKQDDEIDFESEGL